MFDALRDRQSPVVRAVIWVIFALIIISFSLWGVENYIRTSSGADYFAKVGDYRISEQEFNNEYRTRLDQLRNMFGGNIDASLLDNPEQRKGVLDGMIDRQVLRQQATKVGMAVPDHKVDEIVAGMDAFQEDGKFSEKRAKLILQRQGYTVAGFRARLAQDTLLQQSAESITESSITPKFRVEQLLKASEQQREVSVANLAPAQFLAEVKVSDAAAKTYYDGHGDEFKIPEQVKVEYVALTLERFMASKTASEEEVKQRYDQKVKLGQYGLPEERQASHILIASKSDAKPEEKAKAKAKAEALAKEALAAPGKFAELATKNSEDPGSAAQGGDLGFFARGAMVPAFDAAAFSMKEGEIKGPVESEFGFHIIKLIGIKAAKTKPLDEVKAELTTEIKREKAQADFTKAAAEFDTLVQDQSDTLKPTAEKLGIALQQSDYVARDGSSGSPLLTNPKVLGALFSDEVLKDKRNTLAIESTGGVLISARAIDYKPAGKKTFEEAKASVLERLKQQEAQKLAKQKGEAYLGDLKAGKEVAGLTWSAPQAVSRQNPGAAGAALEAIFRADTHKLPAIVGAEGGGGYTLAKITKVVDAPAADEAKLKSYREQIHQATSQSELQAVVKSARAKIDIKVSPHALAAKTEPQ